MHSENDRNDYANGKNGMRKNAMLCLLVYGILGCSIAPKPAECKGEFKPVNAIEKNKAEIGGVSKVVLCNERGLHGSKG